MERRKFLAILPAGVVGFSLPGVRSSFFGIFSWRSPVKRKFITMTLNFAPSQGMLLVRQALGIKTPQLTPGQKSAAIMRSKAHRQKWLEKIKNYTLKLVDKNGTPTVAAAEKEAAQTQPASAQQVKSPASKL